MRTLSAGMLVLVLLTAGAFAGESDWPNFLGPQKNGISPETGINKDWKAKPPKMLWKVPMGDGGFAGPSVAAGKVFIIDHKGDEDVVRAIDLNDGKDVWTFRYKDSAQSNYGFARSTPTVDGDKVYTLSRLGLLHCLSVEDGKKVWELNIVKEFGGKMPQWQLAMSPLIDGDKLIVVPGGRNACVAALNKNTGETIWRGGGSDAPGYATPVVAELGGKKQYVVFAATSLIGVDAEDGKLLWSETWRTQYDVNAATPFVAGKGVFITSNYGRGCAVFRVTGDKVEKVWENKSIQSHFSSPVIIEGHIYGTTDPGRLVCLDPASGAEKWAHRGFQKGGLVVVDGAIIVVDGANGDVALVELTPKGYNELGRIRPLGGQSWTAPIVAHGKLIVRNKSALACLDLK